MKKYISLLLTAVMLFGVLTCAPTAVFASDSSALPTGGSEGQEPDSISEPPSTEPVTSGQENETSQPTTSAATDAPTEPQTVSDYILCGSINGKETEPDDGLRFSPDNTLEYSFTSSSYVYVYKESTQERFYADGYVSGEVSRVTLTKGPYTSYSSSFSVPAATVRMQLTENPDGTLDFEYTVPASGSNGRYSWEFDPDSETLYLSGTSVTTTYGWRNGSYFYEKYAWNYFKKNIKHVVISEGVTKLGYSVFDGYSSLQSVSVPSTVTSIGGYAFRNCSLLSELTLPDGVTEIGESAFYNCSRLSVNIPANVEIINSGAFSNSGLSGELVLPASVKSVGSSAFDYCEITKLVISGDIESFSYEALSRCYSLSEVEFKATPHNSRRTACLNIIPSACPKNLGKASALP